MDIGLKTQEKLYFKGEEIIKRIDKCVKCNPITLRLSKKLRIEIVKDYIYIWYVIESQKLMAGAIGNYGETIEETKEAIINFLINNEKYYFSLLKGVEETPYGVIINYDTTI